MFVILEEASDIGVADIDVFACSRAGFKIAGLGEFAHFLNHLAVKRAGLERHFKAVIFGRVVRASDHDAGVGFTMFDGEVQHRRGAEADIFNVDADIIQAADQGVGHAGRGEATIIADADIFPALAFDGRAEGEAKRIGVLFKEIVADDAAHVVFAENDRSEGVGFIFERHVF